MALDLVATYPGQTAGATANYPQGEARNITVSGDGTGTPWEKSITQDITGFQQAILNHAPVTVPSNVPDNALVSQYLDKLKQIFQPIGSGLPRDYLAGLLTSWVSTTSLTVDIGSARTLDNGADLDNTALFTKLTNAVWAPGAGSTGLVPVSIGLPLATGWYRLFIVGKTDGTAVDFTIDNAATAAPTKFFADPASSAAGFTDSSLFRRHGWIFIDGGNNLLQFVTTATDPRRYSWHSVQGDVNTFNVVVGVRSAFIVTHAPPDSLARLALQADNTSNTSTDILITESGQNDLLPTAFIRTLRTTIAGDRLNPVIENWLVDSSSQLFARTVAINTFLDGLTLGWYDAGLIA